MTLVLNGTTGVSAVDGSASTPAIQGTDTNTGVFFPASDTVAIATGGTERVRADSSGNVGIGTSSPLSPLDVRGYMQGIVNNASVGNASSARFTQNGAGDAAISFLIGVTTEWLAGVDNSDSDSFKISNITGGGDFTSTGLTLTTGGNLLVGTTSNSINGNVGSGFSGSSTTGGSGVAFVYNSASASADSSPCLALQKAMTTTTSSARFVQFYANGTGTPMGGIVGNGASNVQFASISDAREKTNIQDISGSLAKIQALRPVEFDWIADGSHVPAGFVAQDVEQVFPEFVVENMANEGQEARKGLTGGMTGGVIAHLVKAIQELTAKLEEANARITALEAK